MKPRNETGRQGVIARILDRSIFSKYFFACALIMVVSFIVLGTAMVFLTIHLTNSEKEDLYLDNATKISQNFVVAEGMGKGELQAYLSLLQIWSANLDATIYITDSTGRVLVGVPPQGPVFSSAGKFSNSVMAIIKDRSNIKEESKLGGFFDTNHTCAGVPIISTDGSSIEGAIFLTARSGSSMEIVKGIFKIFVFCVCMILFLAFIVIYFVTSRLVRPLRQMSYAAKSFSKGDFTARIPVRGNDEVGQLSVAFNNMAMSLASLEEMRSSFVANVSHELKTPMTSIAGFIDGILDGTVPKEKENYYLKIVSDEVKRLSRLVRSFLDIARIEAGELKITPTQFDVTELARRVIIGFEKPISDKQLEVVGPGEDDVCKVFADFDLTYQIVYNLIDNAVKFANGGGCIKINVAAKNRKVYLSVKNSGMGIPASELPYVFDRFYKTDKSRSRDHKGVGLGLYIVKSVLNMQGEDIVVKSVEGEYCEFVFTLKEVKP